MRKPVELFYEAEKLVRERGFGWEVDWCDSRPCFDEFEAKDFLGEYAWVILNAGMSNQVIRSKWSQISDAFFQFDVKKIVENEQEALKKAIVAFGNKKKMFAIVHVAEEISGTKYLDFAEQVKRNPTAFLQTLPYIGNITKYHLARNLGFDFIKPDRHLVKLANKYGMNPFTFCELIHRETGRRLGTIDVILWRFCEQKGQAILGLRLSEGS